MKKTLALCAVVLAALLILSFSKDLIIKTSVEKAVEIVTGLRLNIEGFRAGIINTVVDIRNLKLYNPPGYADRMMLDMPEIYVDYDLPSIMGGRIHLAKLRIDLKEFLVVKNEKGGLNLNALKVVQAQKESKSPHKNGKAKAPKIQIDTLELKIGRVLYKDYSGGGAPSVREFNININERYSNVKDAYSLVSLIVTRSLANTNIASLTSFDLHGLERTISDTLGTAQKVAVETVTKAKTVVEQAAQVVAKPGEAAKEAKETVTKTAEALTNVFKSSFGVGNK